MLLKIKELRTSRKWSRSKLSILSGVARGYISELESEKYENPSILVICKLCKAFKCTPNDIIDCESYKK